MEHRNRSFQILYNIDTYSEWIAIWIEKLPDLGGLNGYGVCSGRGISGTRSANSTGKLFVIETLAAIPTIADHGCFICIKAPPNVWRTPDLLN